MSEIPYQSDESSAPTEDGSAFIPSIIVKASDASVHLEASAPLHDVRVMVDVARPLVALNSDVTLTTLLDHHQMAFTVKQAETMLPSSLDLKVVAFYQNSSGASQVVQASMHLPLALVARPCVAERMYEHKLTIETNKPSVPSNELFPDFACDITSQTIGIQFLHGPQASILVSKSSQKYRIQSDNFAVLWIPVLELLRRLHQYYKRSSNDETLKCSYSSSLPLQEYFSVIDDYFKIRQEALEVEELLSQRAAQFRVVQKCVLTKLKDKTPTPLNNFDSLLEVTQRELLSLGRRAVELTNEYQRMLSKLSSASQLLVLLLKLKTQMSTEDHKLLQDVFHVDLEASITEGWEEKLEAAICNQLQTGEPDEELPPVPTELTPLKDVTRLKQLIAIIFEKVLDGLRLSENDQPSRKVDNQSKESNHKEPKPEVFSLDSASTMSSPIPGAGLEEERRDAPVFAPGSFPRLQSVRRRIVPSAPDAYRPCPGDGRDNGSVTQRHCVAASGLRSGRPSPKPEAPYATSREKKAVPAYLVLFIDARSCVKFLVGRMPAESTAKVVRTYAPSGMGVCFIFDRRE
ncbi:hypothetical protein HPB49_022423 [Dermacentor silvarum]|uniref:Uncharacterized protein n=1 Tax=Dermacentor silvarum TaxID=543639 RepID=A0ACB8E374_DERSI|nr:hypothetical protein HPB49_022423 [Dermacentor silvarum]